MSRSATQHTHTRTRNAGLGAWGEAVKDAYLVALWSCSPGRVRHWALKTVEHIVSQFMLVIPSSARDNALMGYCARSRLSAAWP